MGFFDNSSSTGSTGTGSSGSSSSFSPMERGTIGALGGGLLGALFGNDTPDFNNPAAAGMPYLDKIRDAIAPYYQSFIDRGNASGNALQGQYGEMTGSPGALYSRLGAGYTESPGYQFKLHQALMAGDNAAAAGGMAGSPSHQQGNMQIANNIASGDFNDYMKNILGLYGQGISGEQGFNAQGYGASGDLATSIGNTLLSKANLASQGANQQNQYNQAQSKADSDMWGSLGGIAGIVSGFL